MERAAALTASNVAGGAANSAASEGEASEVEVTVSMARAGGEAGGGRPPQPSASAPAEQFRQIHPEAAGAITFGHLGAKNLGAFFTVSGRVPSPNIEAR